MGLVLYQIVFEAGVLDDLFQSESNLRIQHLKKIGNGRSMTDFRSSTESTISTSLIQCTVSEK